MCCLCCSYLSYLVELKPIIASSVEFDHHHQNPFMVSESEARFPPFYMQSVPIKCLPYYRHLDSVVTMTTLSAKWWILASDLDTVFTVES